MTRTLPHGAGITRERSCRHALPHRRRMERRNRALANRILTGIAPFVGVSRGLIAIPLTERRRRERFDRIFQKVLVKSYTSLYNITHM